VQFRGRDASSARCECLAESSQSISFLLARQTYPGTARVSILTALVLLPQLRKPDLQLLHLSFARTQSRARESARCHRLRERLLCFRHMLISVYSIVLRLLSEIVDTDECENRVNQRTWLWICNALGLQAVFTVELALFEFAYLAFHEEESCATAVWTWYWPSLRTITPRDVLVRID
jgi:hypothetical protein